MSKHSRSNIPGTRMTLITTRSFDVVLLLRLQLRMTNTAWDPLPRQVRFVTRQSPALRSSFAS